MSKKNMIPFIIAVIGTLTCLISFFFSLSKPDNLIADIAWGFASLFCIKNAIVMQKNK